MTLTEETWRELQSGEGRVERKWVYVIVLVAVLLTAILCIGITYWVTLRSVKTCKTEVLQTSSTTEANLAQG